MKLPRFQFRLRTLMIVVAVVAVVCWVVVDRQRLIRERDEAIERAVKAEAAAKRRAFPPNWSKRLYPTNPLPPLEWRGKLAETLERPGHVE